MQAINKMWKTKAQLNRDFYKLKYRLADVAYQHALYKHSNKSLYIALSHLAEVQDLDVKLYHYEDLYYQHLLPFNVEVADMCSDKLAELKRMVYAEV